MLAGWVNYSFLSQLRVDRVDEEVHLNIEFKLHGLQVLIAHRDGHKLIETDHKILPTALLKRLHKLKNYFNDFLPKRVHKFPIRLEPLLLAVLLKRIESVHEIILNEVFVEQPDYAFVLVRDICEAGLIVQGLLFVQGRQFL